MVSGFEMKTFIQSDFFIEELIKFQLEAKALGMTGGDYVRTVQCPKNKLNKKIFSSCLFVSACLIVLPGVIFHGSMETPKT